MQGEKITDYIFEDDVAKTAKAFGKIVKYNPPGVHRIEYRLRHKAGHLLWVESNPKLLVNDLGTPSEIFDVIRDTTERKAIEADAEASKQQAEHSAMAQAQFLATMSHELRTPLNSIIGFSDIVLDRNDLAPDVRRQIGLIQTASDTLLSVVNDVLDFSKIEEGKMELTPVAFDLRASAEAVVAIVRGAADIRNIELRMSIDASIAQRLIGDDQRIRQILFNLLNNGIKFTRAGHVSLDIEKIVGDAKGEWLRFSVSDTGIGIPNDKLDSLFQRFSQVDGSISREYGGSGLGLAISKRLVEIMGGEIGVESSLGLGSTFWVLLPLPTSNSSELSSDKLPINPSTPARLLLVEDIEINREIACAILRSMGYSVSAVPDGADAVKSVQSQNYDLVLMDIQMPGMDGLTATRKIRALSGRVADIPIIAMTANVLPKQVTAFRSAGMNGHVGKPFKRDDLRSEIERCLSQAALNTESRYRSASALTVGGEQAMKTLTDLLGPTKIDTLLNDLKTQLEQFTISDINSAELSDLAIQAHRLVSSAGMLGFSEVSQYCSRFEQRLLENETTGVTFEEVCDVCTAALQDISARLCPKDDIPERTATLN